MFELNLASLPNYVLYLDGVQLSYIKVFVHIFSLWHSQKPCFITNGEFAKRTNLHRDTVINAIQFFEKHNVLKRIQKGTRRYLVQITRAVEIENEPVDNSPNDSTKVVQESELDQGGVGDRPPQGSELDHHNNKINNKYKKSSYMEKIKKETEPENTGEVDQKERKIVNERRHGFADSMDQMACEQRHIEQHEAIKQQEIKRTRMPDSLRQMIRRIKVL